jgi:hypothetical protein
VRFLSIEPLLEDLGELDLRDIHWAIVGGESGPGCRPIEKQWVLSLRNQCRKAHVPFFFKQWGGFPKGKYGRKLDGRTYDEQPRQHIAKVPDEARRRSLLRVAEEKMVSLMVAGGPSATKQTRKRPVAGAR